MAKLSDVINTTKPNTQKPSNVTVKEQPTTGALSTYIKTNEIKPDKTKAATPETAKPTPLMTALSTKPTSVKQDTAKYTAPISLANVNAPKTSAQKVAELGLTAKMTPSQLIASVNNVSKGGKFQQPVQDNQFNTGMETGAYALGSVLSGDKANTPLTGLRYDLARGAAGVVGAGEGIVDFVVGGMNNLGSSLTSGFGLAPNAVSKWFDEGAQGVYNNDVAGAMRKGIADNVGDNKNWSSNITGELWDMAGNIMAASGVGKAASEVAKVSAPILSKAIFGASQGGNSAQQAYNEGATAMQAGGYGNVIAAATVATESLFGGVPMFGKGVLDDVIKGLNKSPKAVQMLVDTLGEGGEEALQDFITPYLQRIYYNPEAKNATIQQMLTDAAYGAGLSGLMQGAGAIGNIRSKTTTPTQNTATNTQNVPQQATTTPTANIAPNLVKLPTLNQNVTEAKRSAPEAKLDVLSQPKVEANSNLPNGTGAMSNPFVPEQKVSKVFTNTFQKTESLTDEQRAQMKPEDYSYDARGHAQNETAAQQRVGVDYEGEIADLNKKQEWTGEDVFTSKKILDKVSADAEKSGDYAELNKWTKAIQKRGTSGGQTIEAFKAFQKTPEGAVVKAQQVVAAAETKITTKTENGKKVKTAIGRKISSDVANVAKVIDTLVKGKDTKGMAKTLNKVTLKDVKTLVASGKYDADAINELVRSKYGIPTMSTADVQKIYELNKLAQETDSDYQRRAYLNQAARVIADKLPVTGKEKVLAIRRIAMLLNPKTLISRNAGGNVVFGLLEDIKDAPATLIDIAISKKTGVRSTSYNPFATAKAEFLGAKKGLTEWGKDIKNNVDTSPTEHEMPRSHALKSKVGEGTEKVLYRLLQLGDRPFYEAAYAKRIDELKRLGLDYTSEDANGQAMTYALDKVFQNNSGLAKKAMQLRDSLGVIGDIAIPFAQTPANIFDKLADYSPYGFVRAIKKAGTIKDSAWSQKQFVDTLSRSMTGTGILAFAFFAAKSGLITGGDDKEEDESLTYQKKISGWQPYSIVVGDKSYTYDWATVVGALLSLGADISKSDNAGDTIMSVLANGAKAGINTMFNQSYMEGVAELFGGEDIASGLESMVMSLPASFTPTAFQQIAKIIDPIARDTYDSDPLKRAWNKVKAKLPMLSQTLPAKIGASGQESANYQGSKLSNVFEGVLSPGFIGETQKTAIDTEMQRLYKVTDDTAVLPKWSEYTSKSDLSFSGNGADYTMTTQEWEKYQKTRGQYAYKELNKLVNSSEYKGMTDDKKAEAVADIYSESTLNAKETIVEARGEMFIPTVDIGNKIAKYQSAGISQKQAYNFNKAISALVPEAGEKEVSDYQKIQTIGKQGYTDTQAIALVGTLYTDSSKSSMLPYLSTSKHLLSLYLTNKDTDMISMTIPSNVAKDKVEYTLTDEEKETFKSTYANYFNSRVTNVTSAKAIKSLRDKAFESAKLAVINGR